MRACLLVMALLVAWLPSAATRAELPFALRWQAPESCPDEAAATQLIERAVGSDLVSDVHSVRAEIAQAADGYELELWLYAARQTLRRRARAQRCDTFAQLIALELRLTADPLAAPPTGQKADAPRVKHTYGIRAGVSLGSAPVPAPAPSATLGFSFVRARMLLLLGGSYWAPRTVRSKEVRTVTARIDGFGVDARGCYVLGAERFTFPLCGGLELGVLRGQGGGVDQAQRAESVWLALFVAPGLRVRLGGPVWAFADVGAFLGLRRPRFGVRNLPVLYRPAHVSARGGVGLAVQFD